LCLAFYNHNLCLRSIIDSYITLILKVDNLVKVSDYRLISLLNCSIKVITKLMGNRLQSVILRVIHENQYEFFKNRSIQNCLAWSFEYLNLCH
jgi:hypothetical protein